MAFPQEGRRQEVGHGAFIPIRCEKIGGRVRAKVWVEYLVTHNDTILIYIDDYIYLMMYNAYVRWCWHFCRS
jgi:hypothetical protein